MKLNKKKMLFSLIAVVLVFSITIVATNMDNIINVLKSAVLSSEEDSQRFVASQSSHFGYKEGTGELTYDGEVYNYPDVKGNSCNNRYEQLLARDGFIYGMDKDWIGDGRTGGTTISDNIVLGAVSQYDATAWRKDCTNIKALGFNAVNLWLIPGGIDGLVFNEEGIVTESFQEKGLENLREILEICREVGLDFVPSLVPPGLSDSNYLTNTTKDGKTETAMDRIYKYYRHYWDGDNSEARNAFYENAIRPICRVLAEYQDIIPMIALTVENGYQLVNDPDTGMLYSTGYIGATTWENISTFINGLGKIVKEYMPNMMTSVEDVGQDWAQLSYRYNELEYVDIIGRNLYMSSSTVPDPQDLFITKPTYLGEFNVAETGSGLSGEKAETILLRFYDSAQAAGYKGAFYFQYTGGNTELSMFNSDTYEYSTYKKFVVNVAYKIREMKAEYRNKMYGTAIPVLEKPEMLFYTGGEEVYWVGSKGASEYKLERLIEGGSWENIATVSASDMLDNGLLYYLDDKIETLVLNYKATNHSIPKIKYRVTAITEDGLNAVSEESNYDEYFLPDNMIPDGVDSNGVTIEGQQNAASFEIADIKANTDNTASWIIPSGKKELGQIIKDASIARTGEYCLYIDHAKGVGFCDDKSEDGASSIGSGAALEMLVELKPNTRYEFSFWTRNSNRAHWRVIGKINDKNGRELSAIPFPDDPDNDEWVQSKQQFTSPNADDGKETCTVILTFWLNGGGYPPEEMQQQAYIDDVAIKEYR